MMWASSRQKASKLQRGRVPSSGNSVMVQSVPQHTRPAQIEDLRYTKFALDGAPGLKHAVLVPDNLEVTPLVMEQVCFLLDREMPSMFLTGLSSLSHTSKLTTLQLRKSPGFSPLLAEAQRSLGLYSTKLSNESAGQSEKLTDIVDAVREKKIGTMATSLLPPSARTYGHVQGLESQFLRSSSNSASRLARRVHSDWFRHTCRIKPTWSVHRPGNS